jgi:putative transposase
LRIKKSRSAEAQIIGVLREAEGGVPMAELCRKHDMSSASLL